MPRSPAPSKPGTEFRRTLTIFCNQGPKVRERFRLLQLRILNEYVARYAVRKIITAKLDKSHCRPMLLICSFLCIFRLCPCVRRLDHHLEK